MEHFVVCAAMRLLMEVACVPFWAALQFRRRLLVGTCQ
jgi:hypothetical protein